MRNRRLFKDMFDRALPLLGNSHRIVFAEILDDLLILGRNQPVYEFPGPFHIDIGKFASTLLSHSKLVNADAVLDGFLSHNLPIFHVIDDIGQISRFPDMMGHHHRGYLLFSQEPADILLKLVAGCFVQIAERLIQEDSRRTSEAPLVSPPSDLARCLAGWAPSFQARLNPLLSPFHMELSAQFS